LCETIHSREDDLTVSTRDMKSVAEGKPTQRAVRTIDASG